MTQFLISQKMQHHNTTITSFNEWRMKTHYAHDCR